jgi:Tol biopolymer transport system component
MGNMSSFYQSATCFLLICFLADANTGKIIRKVTSRTKDSHLDDLNYLESSGTWSPDSKQFAFVAYKKGYQELVIKDVSNGKTVDEIRIKEVPALSNPAWSPDGKSIVFAGLVQGQTDLYQYDVRTKKTKPLTHDVYSEIQPNWSTDGKSIVYSTDKISMDKGRVNGKYTMNLAIMDVSTGESKQLDFFYGQIISNPEHDDDGNIYFLSDRDGLEIFNDMN